MSESKLIHVILCSRKKKTFTLHTVIILPPEKKAFTLHTVIILIKLVFNKSQILI